MASSGFESPPVQSLSQSDSTLERSWGSVSMVVLSRIIRGPATTIQRPP